MNFGWMTRRNLRRSNRSLAAAATSRARIGAFLVLLALVLSLESLFPVPVAAFSSTTNTPSATTTKKTAPLNPTTPPGSNPLNRFEESKNQYNSTITITTPHERADLLNEHLQRELLDQGLNSGRQITNIAAALREAALEGSDAPSSRYDQRQFGRPSIKLYREFVYSDRYSTTTSDDNDNNPRLLNGLARRVAKQIRNLVKQRIYLAQGIVSPPKHKKITEDDNKTDDYDNDNDVNNKYPPKHFRQKIANSIAKGERRARERNHRNLRTVCQGCARPFNLCLCDVLQQQTNTALSSNQTVGALSPRMMMRNTRLVILQHPNEFRKKHTSTVPLLKLLLGTVNVRIKVGYEFTMKDVLVESSCDNDDSEEYQPAPIMLFPGPDAIDLDQYVASRSIEQEPSNASTKNDADDTATAAATTTTFTTTTTSFSKDDESSSRTKPSQPKHTLVLIDGTWAEAKRMIRKSPEILQGCTMVQFSFDDDDDEEAAATAAATTHSSSSSSRSIYHAMRKEPEEHCLSTLEACGEAIKILEGPIYGPRIQEGLLNVLARHVELHLKNARECSDARHNGDGSSRALKLQRSREIESLLYGKNAKDSRESNSRIGDNNSITTNSDMHEIHGTDASLSKVVLPTIANTPTRKLFLDDAATKSVTIRRLTHEDVPQIDAWWENGGTPKSLTTITRSLDADYGLGIGASLGIIENDDQSSDGSLVACILRYESGPLGILHVEPEYRGKGYGTALLREATKMVSKANVGLGGDNENPFECTALIKDGNTISERVFTKAGFVRENPFAKKGSGKRRANRKWIYQPTIINEE